MASGRRVVGAIRPLVNARDLKLERSRVLHEILVVPVLMYIKTFADLGDLLATSFYAGL